VFGGCHDEVAGGGAGSGSGSGGAGSKRGAGCPPGARGGSQPRTLSSSDIAAIVAAAALRDRD
jgi:hypothetical protein